MKKKEKEVHSVIKAYREYKDYMDRIPLPIVCVKGTLSGNVLTSESGEVFYLLNYDSPLEREVYANMTVLGVRMWNAVRIVGADGLGKTFYG